MDFNEWFPVSGLRRAQSSRFQFPVVSTGNRKVSLILIFTLLCTARLHAAESKEYEDKAGFLFNFTNYIEWPSNAFPDSKAPITIGVFGDDPFGPEFDAAVQGEKVRGRPISINRIRRIDE